MSSAGLIFTTHTPVPAGHDYFPPALLDRYLGDYIRRLGTGSGGLLRVGTPAPGSSGEDFCMTVLALRTASASNGVSKLHGEVSRGMWKSIWPGVPEDEIPIGHVTNGVHFRSWISSEMNQLYDRYLGPKWREEHADPNLWRRVESIPAEELWRTHERRRERLVAFARRRLRIQLLRRGAPQSEIDAADEVLDPDALTIGFARRFATYKRATLLLRDADPALAADSQPAGPAGADPLRRQSASPRRCRQGADPAGGEARRSRKSSAAVWSSWKTTTWPWPGTWSRARTSGSTRRCGPRRPAAPAA